MERSFTTLTLIVLIFLICKSHFAESYTWKQRSTGETEASCWPVDLGPEAGCILRHKGNGKAQEGGLEPKIAHRNFSIPNSCHSVD